MTNDTMIKILNKYKLSDDSRETISNQIVDYSGRFSEDRLITMLLSSRCKTIHDFFNSLDQLPVSNSAILEFDWIREVKQGIIKTVECILQRVIVGNPDWHNTKQKIDFSKCDRMNSRSPSFRFLQDGRVFFNFETMVDDAIRSAIDDHSWVRLPDPIYGWFNVDRKRVIANAIADIFYDPATWGSAAEILIADRHLLNSKIIESYNDQRSFKLKKMVVLHAK